MTTYVRAATLDDVAPLVQVAVDFYARQEYWGTRRPLDVAAMARHLCGLHNNPDAGTFAAERHGRTVGGLALWVAPDVFYGGYSAIKLHWIVDPAAGRGAGLALLRHGEHWARERGCERIYIAGMTDDSTRLLRAAGYAKTEETFQKELMDG